MIIIIGSVLLGAIICILYMFKRKKKNIILKHDITFPNFPKGFGEVSFFFISDILKSTVPLQLIDEVKGKVDFVIIGGNLTEKGVPLERVSKNIKVLKEIGPIYFVWGEQDYKTDAHELDALLLDHKVTILDNTRAMFESESGEFLILLGVDDVSLKRDRLDLALSDSDEEGFRILVSHDASIVNKITKDDGISLVLSGHSQNSQIENFPRNPSKTEGVFKLEDTLLFVSKGYSPPIASLQFRTPFETHIITLHATH